LVTENYWSFSIKGAVAYIECNVAQDERFALFTGETQQTLFVGAKVFVRIQRLQQSMDGRYQGIAVRLESDAPGFIPVCSLHVAVLVQVLMVLNMLYNVAIISSLKYLFQSYLLLPCLVQVSMLDSRRLFGTIIRGLVIER
jgi:hypothetical protein